jgi:hypothetical protein
MLHALHKCAIRRVDASIFNQALAAGGLQHGLQILGMEGFLESYKTFAWAEIADRQVIFILHSLIKSSHCTS